MLQRKPGNRRRSFIAWLFNFRKTKKRRDWFKGVWAEWLAAVWLQLKGYQICERRYKTPVGEVDLIIKKGNLIAAVEVKARPDFESGINSITPKQQQRIQRAFEIYLLHYTNHMECDLRFDVVLIKPWSWPRHMVNAWGTH